MNEIATLNASLTMTSREIAELTGKEHRNVTRDVREMLAAIAADALKSERIYAPAALDADAPEKGVPKSGDIYISQAQRTYLDDAGREQAEYVLDKELTYTLLTGYSAGLRNKVVKRWLALEGQVLELAQSALTLANSNVSNLQRKVESLEADEIAVGRKLDNIKISKEARSKGENAHLRALNKHLAMRLKHSEDYVQMLLSQIEETNTQE